MTDTPEGFRKATAEDLDKFLNSPKTRWLQIYVKWDDYGQPLPLSYHKAVSFPSGRILFVLDDNGNQLLVEKDGTSVLGISTLWVKEAEYWVVLIMESLKLHAGPMDSVGTLRLDASPPVYGTREAAEAAIALARRVVPHYQYRIVKLESPHTLPRE